MAIKNIINKSIIGTVTAAVAAVALVGTLSACSKADSDVAHIKKKGVLVMGTEPGYPPFEFTVEKDGKPELVGLDIEVGKKLAEKLGVTLEIKAMPFDGLIAALQAKKIDVIISGMTPTAERAKNVDFSDQYYSAKTIMLLPANSALATKEELAGKVVGAQAGTTQAQLAHKIAGAQVKELTGVSDLIEQLKINKIDALVIGELIANGFMKTNPGMFKISESIVFNDSLADDSAALAINKQQPNLLKAANELIADMKSKGELVKLFEEASALQAAQIQPTAAATAQ